MASSSFETHYVPSPRSNSNGPMPLGYVSQLEHAPYNYRNDGYSDLMLVSGRTDADPLNSDFKTSPNRKAVPNNPHNSPLRATTGPIPNFSPPNSSTLHAETIDRASPFQQPIYSTAKPSMAVGRVAELPSAQNYNGSRFAPAPNRVKNGNFAANAIGGSQQHRIVVGIDFGTTYSAIAWGDSANPDIIEPIDTWPTTGLRVHHSAPTEISYSEGDTTNFNWGYDIQPSARRLKWFKLLLEMDDADIKRQVDIPPDMGIVDVVTDFLSALYKHTMSTLHRTKGGQLMAITRVDFILTVPAVWTEAAKQRTQRAAEGAGFLNGHRFSMMSEPEAAALYSIKYQDTQSIQVNDRIVVCDCGGGTVDLISYQVLEISPTLRVQETAIGEGDFWGSTRIDRNFEALFKARMGHQWSKLRIETQQKVIKNFEEVKCSFRDRPDQSTYHVAVPTVDTVPEAGIYNGEFEISRDEMKALFDPVINEIIKLLHAQIAASSKESRVNKILLVGGFGESMYLYDRVEAWAGPHGISILQPRGAATAIVKGAVIRGLEIADADRTASKIRVNRLARRNYGSISNQAFIPGVHLEADAYIDPQTKLKMARNQVSWFIRKGQPISDDTKVSNWFNRHFRKCVPWGDMMVASDADVPPTRTEGDVVPVCKMTSDLTRIPKKEFERRWKNWRRFYKARYRLEMTISSAEIKFELFYKDKSYGFAKTDFEQL